MSAVDQFEQLRRAGCSPVRKTGRCANGAQRDGGTTVHFVRFENRRGWSPALCGTRPGRLSGGWDLIEKPFGGEFVCGRCARKLAPADRILAELDQIGREDAERRKRLGL